MNTAKKERLWTKDFILISLINFMLFLTSNMVNPVMSKYLISNEYSIATAGMVVGSYGIAALLVHPFCGIMLDKWNQKKLFFLALAIMAAAVTGYGLTDNLALILLCRICHGGAFAMTSTAIMAILASHVFDSRMGEGVGYFGLTTVIVTSFAPSLGIYLGNHFGFRYSFWCAAVSAIAAFGMMIFVSEKEKTSTDKKRKATIKTHTKKCASKTHLLSHLFAREVFVLSFIASLFSFANGLESSFIVLYGESKDIVNIGTYFTVSAVAVLIARLTAGKLYDKKGTRYVIIPALCIGAVGMFSLAAAGSIAVFWVGAFCKGYGQGAGQPAMQTKALQLAGADKRGVASSTYYLFPDIMQSSGPAIGGWIISCFGYSSVFAVSGVMMLAGVVLYLVYANHMKKQGILL